MSSRCRNRISDLTSAAPQAHTGAMKYANLALLFLFPVAWFAPLLRAALLPVFGMSEISVVTGLQSLWQSDAALALVVTFFAVFAPFAKTVGLALIHFDLLSARALPVLHVMGKLAMADVFLIAVYIVIAKGTGYVTIETAWGLYLFTGLIVASLAISIATARPSFQQGS
jgi:paraquat-inducible protein A